MIIRLKKILTTRKNLSHGWSRLKSFAGKLTDSGKMGQPGNPIQDNLANFSLGLSMLFGRISLILSSEVCQSGNHKKCDSFKTKTDFYHTFNEMNQLDQVNCENPHWEIFTSEKYSHLKNIQLENKSP